MEALIQRWQWLESLPVHLNHGDRGILGGPLLANHVAHSVGHLSLFCLRRQTGWASACVGRPSHVIRLETQRSIWAHTSSWRHSSDGKGFQAGRTR
jgi:hypothetical protein